MPFTFSMSYTSLVAILAVRVTTEHTGTSSRDPLRSCACRDAGDGSTEPQIQEAKEKLYGALSRLEHQLEGGESAPACDDRAPR